MATIVYSEDEAEFVANAERKFFDVETKLSEESVVRKLQIQHRDWQMKAFSAEATSREHHLSTMVHGITEEGCWELLDAIELADVDDQIDAIGDILIYACAIATELGLDFAAITQEMDVGFVTEPAGDPTISLMRAIGKLNHIVGKQRQKTRGFDDFAKVRVVGGVVLTRVYRIVQWMAYCNDWDLRNLFKVVLTKVMERDWVVNKLEGTQGELAV